MIHPKDLYRQLAALLEEIDSGSEGVDYLLSVLRRLGDLFTRDLHIVNGRLYGEDQDRFVRIEGGDILDAKGASLVVRHGTYIFNDPAMGPLLSSGELGGKTTPAAFTVHDAKQRWIFAFDLTEGWIREEVEFCFNAIRAQVNFQLHINAMTSDVAQAAVIQLSLLPQIPPFIAGYQTAGRSVPAEVMGGDFFDFSILDDVFFTIAVGDAMGHGLPAALLVRDVVTGLRMGVEKELKMAESMQKLNRVIHRSTLSANFVSLFFAEITDTGCIHYVNAGHPPPLLVDGPSVNRLESTGMILGAVSDAKFQRGTAHFQPNSVLLLYSDGVVERRRGKEEFGVTRLQDALIQYQHGSATAILDQIHKDVTEFGEAAPFEDDATLVVIKKVS